MTKTDVVAFQNAGLPVGNLGQFAKALATAQTNIALKGGEDFLKLSKRDGLWYYGASETEVQEGSLWAVNPGSLRMGFMAWGKGEVLGKRLLPILSGQSVDRSTLPNVGAEWSETVAFQLRCISGEDEGKQVEYEQNSYGGKKAFAGLCQALQVQIAQDQVNIVPCVVMKSDSYDHKQYGTIFNPIFEVVKWVSLSGVVASADVTESDDGPGEAASPEAGTPTPPAPQKPRRAAVGGAAAVETVAAVAGAAPLATPAKPAVVRQRRRPAA